MVNVPKEYKYRLYGMAVEMASKLDMLVPIEIDGVTETRHKHFFGTEAKYINELHTWGKAGTVTIKTKNTPKPYNRCVTCMLVGYLDNHPVGTYLMWDKVTNRMHKSRNVTWLNRMYFKKTERDTDIVVVPRDALENDEDEGTNPEEAQGDNRKQASSR